jgi:NADH-quinone oxidoreductase subunit B
MDVTPGGPAVPEPAAVAAPEVLPEPRRLGALARLAPEPM